MSGTSPLFLKIPKCMQVSALRISILAGIQIISFYAEVEMVSDVGAHKYIHCRLGKTGITVRASKDANFPPGEVIPLIIDPLRLHLFYKKQGLDRRQTFISAHLHTLRASGMV